MSCCHSVPYKCYYPSSVCQPRICRWSFVLSTPSRKYAITHYFTEPYHWSWASPGTPSQRRQLSTCRASNPWERLRGGESWLWQGATNGARKPVTTEVITRTKLNHNLMQRICAGTTMQDAVLSVQQHEHNCSITGVFIHLPLPFIFKWKWFHQISTLWII